MMMNYGSELIRNILARARNEGLTQRAQENDGYREPDRVEQQGQYQGYRRPEGSGRQARFIGYPYESELVEQHPGEPAAHRRGGHRT